MALAALEWVSLKPASGRWSVASGSILAPFGEWIAELGRWQKKFPSTLKKPVDMLRAECAHIVGIERHSPESDMTKITTKRNIFGEIIGYAVGAVAFYGESGKNWTFSQAYDKAVAYRDAR